MKPEGEEHRGIYLKRSIMTSSSARVHPREMFFKGKLLQVDQYIAHVSTQKKEQTKVYIYIFCHFLYVGRVNVWQLHQMKKPHA